MKNIKALVGGLALAAIVGVNGYMATSKVAPTSELNMADIENVAQGDSEWDDLLDRFASALGLSVRKDNNGNRWYRGGAGSNWASFYGWFNCQDYWGEQYQQYLKKCCLGEGDCWADANCD